jgi:DNA polymerase-3 subunit delta
VTVFYILHGEDEFSRAEQLAKMQEMLAGGDRSMADLNTTFLDGSRTTMGELRHACDAIPFLADRRLVIVEGLLSRLAVSRSKRRERNTEGEEPAWKKDYLTELTAYLPNLPPTTRLVFLEKESLPQRHPVMQLAKKVAKEQKDAAIVRRYDLPKDWELHAWIERRVKLKVGAIARDAAVMLAALVGQNLRMLDQEIEKLLLYTDGRQVEVGDIQKLVSHARETSIFDLVDAVGYRKADQALSLLHRMLDDGQAPLYILGMLARQVRILIQVKQLQGEGLNQEDIASRLQLHPYAVKKALAQGQNFSESQLETAHQRLVRTDWSIKTGASEEIVALDLLVVELCRV